MHKKGVLLVILLFILLSTTGCIDIHYAKDLLIPQKEQKIEREFFALNVSSHEFKSNIMAGTLIEHYDGNATITIPEGTTHMLFDININMRSAEDVWADIEEIIGGIGNESEFPGVIEDLIKLLGQRYLEITIYKPDGTVWYQNRTNRSTEWEVEIFNPAPGDWKLDIVGDGMGVDTDLLQGFEIKDSFTIKLKYTVEKLKK